MAIEKAMWAHGHGMVIEFPDRIASERKLGFYYRVVGKRDTTNWFHFAIPTPVIVDDNRLSIDSAMLRFRSKSTSADVTAVHVYDGEVKILNRNGLNLSPVNFGRQRFNIRPRKNVKWGIGLSVGVRFSGNTNAKNTIEFASAGVDFFP